MNYDDYEDSVDNLYNAQRLVDKYPEHHPIDEATARALIDIARSLRSIEAALLNTRRVL